MRIVAVDTGAIMHGQEPYDLGELRAEVTDRGGTPRVLSLPTFTPHHATCPNAESFRGPRS
jgi:hypothetical protein